MDKRMDCTPEGVFARLCEAVKADVERIRKVRKSGRPASKRLPTPDIAVAVPTTPCRSRSALRTNRYSPRVDLELDGNRIKAASRSLRGLPPIGH